MTASKNARRLAALSLLLVIAYFMGNMTARTVDTVIQRADNEI